MVISEGAKHTVSTLAPTTTLLSYLTGASEVVTLVVGLVTLLWFMVLFWEKFLPDNFKSSVQRFSNWYNRRKE